MTSRNHLGHDVCTVCGAAISGVEARVFDNTCTRLLCRVTRAQRIAQQISKDKQQRRREEARRRKEQALAQRDRLAAELQTAAHRTFQAFALPAQQRPLVPLPEDRKASFREHLERTVQEAFAVVVPAEAPSFSPAEDNANSHGEMSPILRAGCAVCQGRCCLQGGDQAYFTVDLVQRYRAQHPPATAQDVYREYDSRLGERTYENSCVYHQQQGCGLPRELRSDTCNSYECEELAELHREARASGEPLLLVALDGSEAVRWSVCSRSPPGQT
jgi:hypothetical protein